MDFYIFILFFIIALLYASVGFGGGYTYMAILALLVTPFLEMRTLGLCCNIIVIFINIYYHWKEKNIDWKNTLLVCSLSIPLAYIGSLIPFEETTFLQILGISLIIESLMIGLNYFLKKHKNHTLPKNNLIIIGIGGGIILSPVLYLMHFSTPIKIAALSSIFIAVNSIAVL
ncbi:MAG: TSUP family transporter [Chitinophagaceae bacterium]